MSQQNGFEDMPQAVNYAGISPAGGLVAESRQGMTVEDVIYRVATVTAVLFILVTML